MIMNFASVMFLSYLQIPFEQVPKIISLVVVFSPGVIFPVTPCGMPLPEYVRTYEID